MSCRCDGLLAPVTESLKGLFGRLLVLMIAIRPLIIEIISVWVSIISSTLSIPTSPIISILSIHIIIYLSPESVLIPLILFIRFHVLRDIR